MCCFDISGTYIKIKVFHIYVLMHWVSNVSLIQGLALCMARYGAIPSSSSSFVQEIAWFLGVFGINTTSDISKFTKISRAATPVIDIWGVLKYQEPVFIPNTQNKPCCFLFILQGKKKKIAPYVTGIILTCKYFKFGLNTTGLSESHLKNLSACSIIVVIFVKCKFL